jgi:hypothetical protein|tara:strand:+ start:11520 stop:11735 length:216 start_codon:yes stop_codon:yes gene_type:complete
MDIVKIEKLSKAFDGYSKRRKELEHEPTTVNIFEDKALVFHATKIHSTINEIVEKPVLNPPKKNKKANKKG